MPVTTPTGSSRGRATVLAIVSDIMRKTAPARKEETRRMRWSGPTRRRRKWGTTRPTKPMMPASETHSPVRSDVRIKSILFVLSTFMPRWSASSSPRLRALRSKQKKYEMKSPAAVAASASLDEKPIRLAEGADDPEKDAVEVFEAGDGHDQKHHRRAYEIDHDSDEEEALHAQRAPPRAHGMEKEDRGQGAGEARKGKRVRSGEAGQPEDAADGDAEGRPAGDAERVRLYQWVAEEALQDNAGEAQSSSHREAQQYPGKTYVENDAEVCAAGALPPEPGGPEEGDARRPDRKREETGGEQKDDEKPQGEGPAKGPVHSLISRPGWTAAAMARSASTNVSGVGLHVL